MSRTIPENMMFTTPSQMIASLEHDAEYRRQMRVYASTCKCRPNSPHESVCPYAPKSENRRQLRDTDTFEKHLCFVCREEVHTLTAQLVGFYFCDIHREVEEAKGASHWMGVYKKLYPWRFEEDSHQYTDITPDFPEDP